MSDLQVAEEIWSQMKTLDRNLIMCMGVKNRTVIKQGLRFEVNGLIFKGRIEIILTPADLYKVTLFKNERQYYGTSTSRRYNNVFKEFKTVDGLFFDQLMPYLESVVERETSTV